MWSLSTHTSPPPPPLPHVCRYQRLFAILGLPFHLNLSVSELADRQNDRRLQRGIELQ